MNRMNEVQGLKTTHPQYLKYVNDESYNFQYSCLVPNRLNETLPDKSTPRASTQSTPPRRLGLLAIGTTRRERDFALGGGRYLWRLKNPSPRHHM